MSVTLNELERGASVEIYAGDKCYRTDYARLNSAVRQIARKHGKLRVLFVMHDFHAWDGETLWNDIQLDPRAFTKVIERAAFTGDRKWKHWMTRSLPRSNSFRARYFDRAHEAQARRWLRSAR